MVDSIDGMLSTVPDEELDNFDALVDKVDPTIEEEGYLSIVTFKNGYDEHLPNATKYLELYGEVGLLLMGRRLKIPSVSPSVSLTCPSTETFERLCKDFEENSSDQKHPLFYVKRIS